ncbi:hypothetical protein OPT61_g9030 [Boeremia exigua]|uniref:Uncharacterized protein n=1 Tax=Boeremia exigua TaxID=749465 RepID=A0ACC2HWM1_9PLEO|nr:hypothetical protein OPT61_g9030 [Boeremia exigua]
MRFDNTIINYPSPSASASLGRLGPSHSPETRRAKWLCGAPFQASRVETASMRLCSSTSQVSGLGDFLRNFARLLGEGAHLKPESARAHMATGTRDHWPEHRDHLSLDALHCSLTCRGRAECAAVEYGYG